MLSSVGIETSVETMPASVFLSDLPEEDLIKRRNLRRLCQVMLMDQENLHIPFEYLYTQSKKREVWPW